ncbi:MAG: hypothetical protein LUI02_03745, partial [Clostridiales bacterium]|nr:hypothetical protein [Clostridiales bacterium]
NTWAAAGASYDVVSDDGSNALGGDLTTENTGYTAIWYSEDGDSDMVAKTGTYTIRYRLTYADGDEDDDNAGATVKTPTFSAKVTNSLVLPKVNVTTRTADSLDSDDIIKCLETNVDMNNNDSLHESIDGVWYKDGSGDYVKGANEGASGSTATIGYVEVYDTSTVGNVEWHFFIKKAAAGPHVDMGIPNTQKLILRTELLIHNLIFCKSF